MQPVSDSEYLMCIFKIQLIKTNIKNSKNGLDIIIKLSSQFLAKDIDGQDVV